MTTYANPGSDGAVVNYQDRYGHYIGGEGLADRLAVVPALGHGEDLEVLLHAVGDLVEDEGPLGR